MPCYTVWSAPISPVAMAPDFARILQSPEAVTAIATVVGMVASQLLPPDQVIQEVMAAAPELPAILQKRLTVVPTSTGRRMSRTERDAELAKLLQAGRLFGQQKREQEDVERARAAYAWRLSAAEGSRQRLAAKLPWPPMFVVLAQTFLQEVQQVLPDARLTRPDPAGGAGLTSTIKSATLGGTTIAISGTPERLEVRVQGEVPGPLDEPLTRALARGFAHMHVESSALRIEPLPGITVDAAMQQEVESFRRVAAEQLVQVLS